jgi:hypothetical protein
MIWGIILRCFLSGNCLVGSFGEARIQMLKLGHLYSQREQHRTVKIWEVAALRDLRYILPLDWWSLVFVSMENEKTFLETSRDDFSRVLLASKSIDAAERASTSPELDKPETLYA